MNRRRRVVLVQLPIPQPGPAPAYGNVPLAPGYLALFAQSRGLDRDYDIEIFPATYANRLSDLALVEAIAAREPWMVGFTCYLWNVERTLWIAERLRARHPEIRVLVGGPEITRDNAWVLTSPQVDFAAIGEGEQTFADLLEALSEDATPSKPIPGLYVSSPTAKGSPGTLGTLPPARAALPRLDAISSPYLAGFLDAADEKLMLLETIRGCVYKCKFCYYPKSYDDLYFLSQEKIVANLEHARTRGAREVILLDPTLNQRPRFDDFLRLLADCNPDHQFTYFGELRAEGIGPETARLLRAANFHEVEIGLQSIDPETQTLMDRRNNLRAFERGVGAMLGAGLHVTIDLIIGLPGDTVESVRRSIHYVRDSGLYSDIQVFNLAVLPGTAFREESARLGLTYQPRPPYYVLGTPTLEVEDLCGLMAEAEETFATEFDALPAPHLDRSARAGDPQGLARSWTVDLDARPEQRAECPPAGRRAVGFTLWLRGEDLGARGRECAALATQVLEDNPHTTLQVVLEPTGDPRRITPVLLEEILEACYRRPTYLDRFYSIAPGGLKGTKRIVVVAPEARRRRLGGAWIGAISECATLVWRGHEQSEVPVATPEPALTD